METKFYTFFIEQIIKDGVYSEYTTTKGYGNHQQAQVAYFQTLANLSNDMGKNHTYALCEIRDSFGNVYEKNVLGTRVMPEVTE